MSSLTTGSAIVIGSRRSRLGPLIKSGGAGSVYLLADDPHSVAKIYHARVDPPSYTDRIEAMLQLRPKLPDQYEAGKRYVQIAWPDATVRDAQGRFVGFTMPALDVQSTNEVEQILQERQARAAGLPVGLGHKVTLAANLASVLAALHAQHHYVVDLKPVNLRFYRASLYIALLDCDGFSIQGRGRRFHAPQFTPDYLAPEYQVRALDEAGEETQDRFALAVVIFQLLNFGIHPYSGRPAYDRVPTDVPGRIRERCYAYSQRGNPMMAPNPVSGHALMPRGLRDLFDRAFGEDAGKRPSSSEWSETLRAYAQPSRGLIVICAKNREHQHYNGEPCAACVRHDLLNATARKAASRPPPSPRAAAARAPAQAQPQRWWWTARTAPPAPAPTAQPRQRLARPPPLQWNPYYAPPQSAPVAPAPPRSGWRARLPGRLRALGALAAPLAFGWLMKFVQGYYESLRAAAATPLDRWTNSILLTFLGMGFAIACYVFLVAIPRRLARS
ncbi:hypothetical protein J5226_21905 [Lysobacter sp. K5869]|uniref:hypothetical protein n=1 Tax=Lysobacter sp. K5869 TaxID=2820808 RepID=UPI001C061195|nr:hypothetical protein [Lysobacter sp. K5869]QWP76212.1 hypothetical protein J5226_21905 [Lysobacter sp. K5869]